ncbi:hypothetical protein [Rathayibacter sp. VKM Ac-2630]|uniref:hypothetical protein n=1 Tax=Rathayibacter sp. VKM Ac-2630 TaxID=1938617 RepID=UPI0009825385|nr:hypothetical protein [Rathayibacter sp. VKM Ac-2630]OOB92128.1 hypothetical protein B0T42_01540 [Rathayibacter sp. VKM Ac-2630]
MTRARLLPALGALLLVAGVVVALIAPRETSFGWFAYAPLSTEVFTPDGTLLLRREWLVSAALFALGLVVLAFWTGIRTGSRQARRRD